MEGGVGPAKGRSVRAPVQRPETRHWASDREWGEEGTEKGPDRNVLCGPGRSRDGL